MRRWPVICVFLAGVLYGRCSATEISIVPTPKSTIDLVQLDSALGVASSVPLASLPGPPPAAPQPATAQASAEVRSDGLKVNWAAEQVEFEREKAEMDKQLAAQAAAANSKEIEFAKDQIAKAMTVVDKAAKVRADGTHKEAELISEEKDYRKQEEAAMKKVIEAKKAKAEAATTLRRVEDEKQKLKSELLRYEMKKRMDARELERDLLKVQQRKKMLDADLAILSETAKPA